MKFSLIRHTRSGFIPALIFSILAVGLLVSAQDAEQNPENQPKAPETIQFPSPIGQVDFPHQMHAEDLGMDCSDCHHPVQAPELQTPHPQYFDQSTVKCQTCHHPAATAPKQQKCSVCHNNEAVIPNHELSAKVAIHTLCSDCHEIGTGKDASESCSFCHSGPKSAW